MKRYHDLVYAHVSDRRLKLDLYLPGEGEGPFPVNLRQGSCGAIYGYVRAFFDAYLKE
jgi:hypothetical protein